MKLPLCVRYFASATGLGAFAWWVLAPQSLQPLRESSSSGLLAQNAAYPHPAYEIHVFTILVSI